MNPSTLPPPRLSFLHRAVLAFVPILSVIVGYAFLPRPESAVQARSSFDRAKLQNVLLDVKPSDIQGVDAILGEKIRILGTRVSDTPLRRGEPINPEFFFEVMQEFDRNWQMFVHIDREGATYRIHGDHWPTNGTYPTSYWRERDLIRDAYDLRVPLDAPAGRYSVYIGFYIGDERLPFSGGDKSVHDGSNRVRVGQIQVQ